MSNHATTPESPLPDDDAALTEPHRRIDGERITAALDLVRQRIADGIDADTAIADAIRNHGVRIAADGGIDDDVPDGGQLEATDDDRLADGNDAKRIAAARAHVRMRLADGIDGDTANAEAAQEFGVKFDEDADVYDDDVLDDVAAAGGIIRGRITPGVPL
ncbi:MAG: hypothetical protein OXC62_02600 [Aestuariivita sp.]|nr:hypothetical protein [Aestuariivita sp.]